MNQFSEKLVTKNSEHLTNEFLNTLSNMIDQNDLNTLEIFQITKESAIRILVSTISHCGNGVESPDILHKALKMTINQLQELADCMVLH